MSFKWKPIDTAPRDGTSILAWDIRNGEYVCAWWDVFGKWCMADEYTTPTHWMPLPKPPK